MTLLNLRVSHYMNKKHFIIGTLILAISVLIAYLTLVVKWEKVELEVGLSQAAKEEPLLAAKLLLEKHNISFTRLKSADSILQNNKITLNHNTSLMIDEAALLEHPQLEAAILEWVASGGHLIYVLSPQRSALNIDINTSLLDVLELAVQNNEDLYNPPYYILSKPQANTQLKEQQQTLSLYQPFTYSFSRCSGKSHYLIKNKVVVDKSKSKDDIVTENANADFDENIILICDTNYQQGFITFLPSIYALSTQSLKHLDHGAFLLWLVGKNDHLYYLPSFKTSNWLIKLWQWSWLAILLIVVAMIASIWYLAIRFGSAVTPINENKSLFKDHIRAMGNFLYAYHDQQLKKAILLDLEQAIANRNSHYKKMSNHEKAQVLSQLTGKDISTIKQLLTQDIPKQAHARIQYIQLFKALRKAL